MSSFWFNATVHSYNTSESSNATFSLYNKACNVFDNSFSVKIGLILVFSTIMLFSLVGNAFIIVIVYQRKDLRKTTNYVIVNMAASDFAYQLSVIPERIAQMASNSRQWPLGGTGGYICKAMRFLDYVSFAVSSGSLVCIAVDRFVAVVFPMKAHLVSSRFRTTVIAAIWILALILNSLDLYAFELVELRNGDTICAYVNDSILSFRMYYLVYSGIFAIGPLMTITILYCVIAVTLRKQDRSLRGTSVHQKDRRKRQAIKMTVCVIAAFYICILPSGFRIGLDNSLIVISCSVFKVVWFISYIMLYLSSLMNPIICMTFVQSFRQGFKEIMTCWRKCFTSRSDMEASQSVEIALEMRIIPGIGENPSFTEN